MKRTSPAYGTPFEGGFMQGRFLEERRVALGKNIPRLWHRLQKGDLCKVGS